ncbi:hypothetical protein [Streptacidiphilus melanogenes]|uniref:hypothetical protein n=1 Tax=Streptacidiphilus melanogenes TaxID=411235 RepID=UPI0005A8338E|nr:hypothetical protein [Streptacidiphilus melanogenes]
MEPDRPEELSGSASPADAEPAAPLSMLDAVGRLSPEQAGLLGVLIGLRRLDDGTQQRKPEA